jgi:hypothetical protein
MIRTLILSLLACAIAACSGSPAYNPSVFPYEINEEELAKSRPKRVVIATVNLGGPSRSYLEEMEPTIDKAVADYLEENGFRIVPQRRFEQQWKTALRIYGDPVDPTSGRVNQKTFTLALVSVRDALQKSGDVDAIVFTDIIERDINFSGGLKHLARWDGVSRKPSLQGPGEGVSADFDWNKSAKGASLWVNVYNMELQRVFTSIGGMDTTEAIDTRSASGEFVRRRSLLESEANVREGVELAFHPFIQMKNYPGNP